MPPTIFFFLGFNFIVLTSNLLVARYVIRLSNFMLATMAALVVGKAVLVANKIPLLRRYDRAPLIQPILFKTVFYWVIVFFVRILERFVHFLFEGNAPEDFGSYLITTFSGHRFLAISLWVFVLFLIYVSVSEFSQLFGPSEIPRLLFTRRPSDLQLTRRQRHARAVAVEPAHRRALARRVRRPQQSCTPGSDRDCAASRTLSSVRVSFGEWWMLCTMGCLGERPGTAVTIIIGLR